MHITTSTKGSGTSTSTSTKYYQYVVYIDTLRTLLLYCIALIIIRVLSLCKLLMVLFSTRSSCLK